MKNRFPEVVSELVETPDKRLKSPSPWVGIVIHHTGIGERSQGSISKDLWKQLYQNIRGWLVSNDKNYVSAHFLIGREGECSQLADPDNYVTFHAGVSEYYHPLERKIMSGWNSYAIGIELLGDGDKDGFTDEQYHSTAKLCAYLMDRYRAIDPRCITGHENVSPGRKRDPGRFFSWRKFFDLLHLYRMDLESISLRKS
jgi:AmpD protein